MAVNPIPPGFHSITPYFSVNDAKQFMTFLKKAFSAEEHFRMNRHDGTIAHASMQIGDSMIEVSDARPEFPAVSMSVHLFVENVDAVYNCAVSAGAVSVMAPMTQFYGDRESYVKDPFGNNWYIATHVEDVPEDEIERRMKAQDQ
ncbi:MAG: VOC family protein [Chitinophagales bacterium]|nr:VOC family protein [Chitinophagales bacterium]